MHFMPTIFLTTVSGIGPWCLECSDGEIITSRSHERIVRFALAELAHMKSLAKESAQHDITK